MAWYSTGTIQVAANGTVATGTGTQFLGNVRIGDGITIAGSTAMHEVAGVTSDTQLTFAPPYAGSAGAGKAYRIAPVLGYDKDLSDAFNALRLAFGDDLAALKPWATAATPDAALTDLQFTAIGKAIARAANQAAGRDALGLGSAATRGVAQGVTPGTGLLMPVGSGGILSMLDLRAIGVPEWKPQDVFGKGTFFGFTSGFSLGIPGLSVADYGVLETSGQYHDSTGNAGAAQRTFKTSGKIFYQTRTSPTEWGPWLELIHAGNAAALPLQNHLGPAADNFSQLGVSTRRFSVVFAATGTINTSDAREKDSVRSLTDAEYAVGLQLAREIGAYQWLEAIERKGDSARWHIGQTVQRAMAIFEQHGLDPFAYGAICYDSWDQETVEHPAEYEQIEVRDPETDEVTGYEQGALIKEAWTEVTQAAGDRYSWRDNELLWLMVAAQKRQQDELAAQQTDLGLRLAALERAGA